MDDKTERLQSFDNAKLMDVVKNYKHYGYDDTLRDNAVAILKSRGVNDESLDLVKESAGNKTNLAQDLYRSYKRNSGIAFALFISLIVIEVLRVLVGHQLAADITIFIVDLICLSLYLLFIVLSLVNQNEFYKTIGKELGAGDQAVYILIGMPLYIFMYFYYRNKMNDEIKAL